MNVVDFHIYKYTNVAQHTQISQLCLREIGLDYVKWICLVQDRDKWQALVNMVLELWVP
jgi:hypothetical protein